jgi:haloalkane dehalogenase
MKAYRDPFPTVASRKPIRQWPCEIPFGGTPADVHEIVSGYRKWLETSEIPKLMLHATPGAIIRPEVAEELKTCLSNLTAVDLGEGIHFLQEDHPHEIGEAIANWVRERSV